MKAPAADFSASPELEKLFEKLIKAVEGLKGSFSSGINVQFPTLNFKDMFKNPFKGLGDRISKQFDKFGDVLKAPFKKLGDMFKNPFKGLGDRISAQFGKFGDVLKAPFKKLGDGLGKMFGFRKKSPEEKTADLSKKTYRLLFRVIRPLVKNVRDDLRAVKKTSDAMLGELKKISAKDKGKDRGGDKKGADFGKRAKNALTGIGKGLGKAMESILKGFASGLTKMGNAKVLKGILNLGLLGVSLIPFALALKLFAGIRFDKVFIGIGALAAIGVIARLLGDPSVVGFIFLGAAAIAALGLALIPFGFGLDLIAGASEKLIPFLEALGETFTTIVQPAITIAKELFDTLKVSITTIGDTIQSIVDTIGGVFTTAIESARDIALAVVDAVASSFDSTIELIKFLEGTSLTGTKLFGIAAGVGALAIALMALSAGKLFDGLIEGMKSIGGAAAKFFGKISGGLLDFGGDGPASGPLETLKQLASLGANATFLEKLPDILDNITAALDRLFNTDYNVNNFMRAMGELTSGIISFQTNAVEPFTTANVGETAVGLATGAEAAGGAAMAPVINNVVTNSSAPTQIVPDSNIGSRSTDRDVFSPLDNHSPFSFAGL